MKNTLIITAVILILVLSSCSTQPEPAPAGAPDVDPGTSTILEQGKLVFQANCSACHNTANKDVIVGPSMDGLASRAGDLVDDLDTRGYIEQSILDPAAYLNEGYQNLMPATYINSLSDEEVNALVEYLLTFE